MIVSWREPNMSTLLMLILSFTSTLRSFSVTSRSPGETCRCSGAHLYAPSDIEGHLVYKVIATLDSMCLRLSADTTLACVYHATYSSMGQ